MFDKKVKLFLITLIFMLSISVVSAGDFNKTDEMTISDEGEEPPSGISDSTISSVTVSLESDDEYKSCSGDTEIYCSDENESKESLLNSNENSTAVSSVSNSSVEQISNNNSTLNLNNVNTSVLTSGSVNSKVKVLPLITSKNVVGHYGSSVKFTSKFFKSSGEPLKNTNVKFKIGSKTYNAKTNAYGVAAISLKLKNGVYKIYSINPSGYKIANTINVKSSLSAGNLVKHYKSSKKYKATFYNKNGQVLAKKKVKFKFRGKYYTKKTNSKGVASLKISSKTGSYKIKIINPKTGEKKTATVKVKSTISAKNMKVFTGRTSTFKATLYKNDKLKKGAKVIFYVDGKKKVDKTNSKGVAKVKFKLSKGSYTFKVYDPYTKHSVKKKVSVKLASLKASKTIAIENKKSKFQVLLLKQNGNVAKKTKLNVTIDGEEKTIKTNSKGVASVNFKLKEGNYYALSEDLSTGYELKTKITVVKESKATSYNKYGVSDDGKTLMAVGRPSASGELSKYGYTYYITEFKRVCPYCGSTEIYWSIFWAGDETSNWGVFPATGNRESGSAEGQIFCAECDADWSIFGHNHAGGLSLDVVSGPEKSSKETAYILKNGDYIKV